MMSEADLNILVSNVVSENRYKHCRLCLKDLQEHYVRFEDCVSSGVDNLFRPLGEVLRSYFGEQICDDIPGVDAVCAGCLEQLLECNQFMDTCKRSTNLLHKIFDNLSDALNIDLEETSNSIDQCLYVIVGENESKVVLMDKEKKKQASEGMLKYLCQTCDTQFDSANELRTHTCKLTRENNIKCPDCDQYRSSEDSLKQHQDKAHTLYVCKECGKSYHGLDKLQAHEEKHSAKSECPKCGKTYLTKDFYLKHVKLCLSDQIDLHPYRGKIQKTYFCEKCGKGYSTSGGLRVHDRFVHGNAKPHICEHCGKKFTAPSYLKIHMVKHTGEKKFKCNICLNKFVSKEALLYHTRRHTGEKPYSCHICGERFVNASARAEHIKFKHTGPTLTCNICNRKFFTSNFLKQHISRHHDPSSKLYSGRNMIPPNVPGEQNMRTKIVEEYFVLDEEMKIES